MLTLSEAEVKIARAEKRFRALIENAPDGIALVGLDGKYKTGGDGEDRFPPPAAKPQP